MGLQGSRLSIFLTVVCPRKSTLSAQLSASLTTRTPSAGSSPDPSAAFIVASLSPVENAMLRAVLLATGDGLLATGDGQVGDRGRTSWRQGTDDWRQGTESQFTKTLRCKAIVQGKNCSGLSYSGIDEIPVTGHLTETKNAGQSV